MEILSIYICAAMFLLRNVATSENSTKAPSTISATLPNTPIILECASGNQTCDNFTSTIAPPTVPAPNDSLSIWQFDRNFMPNHYKYTPNQGIQCHCDLQARYCDINCCCDADCSYQAKEVFSKCEDLPINERKINYCNYMQYVYNNRILQEVEVKQNGLFCIMKTNLPAHYIEQKRQIIANPINAYDVIAKSSTYNWANSANVTNTQFEQIQHALKGNFTNYQPSVGDQLFILRNYSTPAPFELPASFITPDCIRAQPIEYLNNYNSRCRQPVNNLNHQLTVQYYSQNITFLSSLRHLNISMNTYQGCPKNVCIPLNSVHICDQFSCRNLSKDIITQCNQKSCSNVVTNVKFHFYHNATHGVRKIHLDLVVANITLPSAYVEQQFTVEYFWLNQTRLNYSDFRSGNPGYIFAKPILISTVVTVANLTIITQNTTANSTKIIYSKYLQSRENNYLENFMALPKNVNGKCVLSNDSYQPVEFGYNVLTKCAHVQGYFFNSTGIVQSKSTYQSIIDKTCRLIQNNILAYWNLAQNLSASGDFEQTNSQVNESARSNNTFGHFGNANRSRLEDWGYYLYDLYPDELLHGNRGQNFDRNHIECKNVSTRIKYNIFYERVDDNQNRVAAIYVEFLNLQTVQLQIAQSRVFINILLTSEVMFYDVTATRNLKYVRPPSLNIKLPYDFFYPFVKVAENHSNPLTLNSFNFILMILIITNYT